jgi:RNA polymerase-binding transcription factor DksA
MPLTATAGTLEDDQHATEESPMSTIAIDEPGARPLGARLAHGSSIDRSEKAAIERGDLPRIPPGRRVAEAPATAATAASARRGRGPLTVQQLAEIRRSLQDLAELEENRVERVATVGSMPLAAYDIGIRDAVRDALQELADGTYGDCESCRRPIPVARLEAVPYARRCVACQAREESGWDQVQRLIAGIVRRLAGEPQGRPEALSRIV